jgi:hypothetical protein
MEKVVSATKNKIIALLFISNLFRKRLNNKAQDNIAPNAAGSHAKPEFLPKAHPFTRKIIIYLCGSGLTFRCTSVNNVLDKK